MKPWMFLQNPILNVTNDSFIGALNLSIYHDNALFADKDDPFILTLYTSFHPLHLNYQSAYGIWKSQGGIQQGETLNIAQLLDLLAYTKIQQWDIQIQGKYPQNTPAYKKLLPNRRKPFQSGKQNERLQALLALKTNINTDTSLATLSEEINTFYTQLNAAFGQQKENQSSIKGLSDDLEDARKAMCIGQYANLGALIQKYAENPERAEKYFDMTTIRRAQQLTFTGQLKPSQVYTVVKHTFGPSDQVTLTNQGPSQLKFYLSHARDTQPGTTFIMLGEGEQTVLASSMGKLTDPYVTVLNTDPLLSGEFSIELE